eukprot:jgi/Botrbrau1/23353/Bobra.0051s0011.1
MKSTLKNTELFKQRHAWDNSKWIAVSLVLLCTAVVSEASKNQEHLHARNNVHHAPAPSSREHLSHRYSSAMPGSLAPSNDRDEDPSWADFFSPTAHEGVSAVRTAGAQGPSTSQPHRRAGAAPLHSKVPYIVVFGTSVSENGTCFYPRIVDTLARTFSTNLTPYTKTISAPPVMHALAEAFYVVPLSP